MGKGRQGKDFVITVHFSNGYTVQKVVPLKRALTLASKQTAIIENDSDFVEIKGVSNSIIVPVNITFVINASPNIKHVDKVNKFMLYKRDNGKCVYCGKELTTKNMTVDHVIPKSKGGKHEWENVVTACVSCNCKKDSRTPEEAGMTLRVKPYNPKKHKQ